MEPTVPVSPLVRKILRWMEWVSLVNCVTTNLLSIEFYLLSEAHLRLVLFIAAVGALSLFLPTQQPLWQRRAYIAVELLLLVMADVVRLQSPILFELFIIKACLLLPRRDVIIAVITMICFFMVRIPWLLPTQLEEVRSRGIEPYLNPWRLFFNDLTRTVTSSIFVIMLGFVFAAEQRSRHRAEMLALEVEALATKLERTRIARDMHDSLGHSLTTLDVQLALAQRYSEVEGGKAKLQSALKMAQQLAAQCLAEVRQSLQTMRQPNFDLEAALGALGEQMRQWLSFNLQVQLPPLSHQLSYQLYLIAKEGLINVQKHAQATQATLSLVVTDDQIVLTLMDDGCGFNVSETKSGYGLQGIKERSQLLGGRLTVDSRPRQGTQLQVTAPFRVGVERT